MGVSEVEGRGEAFLLDGYQEDFRGEKEEFSIGDSLFDEVCGCRNNKADYRNGYTLQSLLVDASDILWHRERDFNKDSMDS